MDLLRKFEEGGHNGREVRPTTFWSWNDRLDSEEVRRQIREMAKAGLGGHFMHARRGLKTPYLGPEWMDAVRAAVDEARHTGVTPWLYDEDCWPSGTCSGRVYDGHEQFQGKHLMYEEIDPSRWEMSEHTVAVYVARREGEDGYRDFERLDDPHRAASAKLASGQVLLHFAYRMEEDVDVLNRAATGEFLKRTHEVYREAVGREFSRLIPGIFTDEPMYGRAGHHVPWSTALPRFYNRSTGADLLDHLPSLFFPVGVWRQVRFDFYESLTRLFLLAWTMPVYQWCGRNRLALTGHMMAEDTLLSQVQFLGAAMPHYEYMHIPGIDHLGRGLGSPVLVKQAASAAAQLGRRRVLSEMFGCSGWNVSFDDLRWIAEWQFVLGVNLVCQHLSSYTLAGDRKRDFPPSLHYHQPWWPNYWLWNDYAGRLLSVLTAGEPVVDVLVLHPIASAWAEFSPLDAGPVKALDEKLRHLVDTLLGMHADFHFGDELILERHARVEKGELIVGPRRYRAVIVPDATTLRKSTVDLLKRFRRSKGRLVFAGRVPETVDGVASDDPASLARGATRLDPAASKGRASLKRAVKPGVAVLAGRSKSATGVLAQWRTVGKDQVFFFLNTEPKEVKATVRVPAVGTVVRMDPATGRSWELEANSANGRSTSTFKHAFGPRESLLVLVRPKGEPVDAWEAPAARPSRRKVLGGKWEIRRRDPNALVLDRARWRTDEGEYSEPMDVRDIQQTLFRAGAQERIVLKYKFHCRLSDVKGRRFELVMEDPGACEMWFAGMRTPLTDVGSYWDSAFRRVDVTPYVRKGENTLEIRRPWHVDPHKRACLLGLASGWEVRTAVPDTEVEAVYVIGDFGVAFEGGTEQGGNDSRWMKGPPVLVEESEAVNPGDLLRSGYPMFAGCVTLTRDVVLDAEPDYDAVLELPPFGAVTARVEVNGQEAGLVWKTPRTVPVGELLQKGSNRIQVTLSTSLRNLLGPHHHKDGEIHWVSPGSFAGATGRYGRAAVANRSYRADYNVVEPGFDGEVALYY